MKIRMSFLLILPVIFFGCSFFNKSNGAIHGDGTALPAAELSGTSDTLIISEYSSLYGLKNLEGVPIMQFEQREFDLGKVKKGDKKTIYYHFINKGDTPLKIDIISACECTTTDYPTGPIPPGGKGMIKAVFDSTEKDYSELIDIEILLRQTMPGTDIPIIEKLYYRFDIE